MATLSSQAVRKANVGMYQSILARHYDYDHIAMLVASNFATNVMLARLGAMQAACMHCSGTTSTDASFVMRLSIVMMEGCFCMLCLCIAERGQIRPATVYTPRRI